MPHIRSWGKRVGLAMLLSLVGMGPLLHARSIEAESPLVKTATLLPEFQVRNGVPNFHAKASAGEQVRVAFLGGSITVAEGCRVKTLKFLRERYPKAQIEEIFAGISGTGSSLGVARLDFDVLSKQPDLLFVEFAVNDGAQPPAQIEGAMEGIVRKLRRQNPRAEICFVYTLSKAMVKDYAQGNFNASAKAMERVADYYGIPSIAFGVDVVAQLATGRWVFQADKSSGVTDAEGRTIFSYDGIHPIDAGHQLYAGAIMRAWPQLAMTTVRSGSGLPPPLREDNWEHARLTLASEKMLTGTWQKLPASDPRLSGKKITPPVWWTTTPGSTIETTVTGSVLGVYGLKSAASGRFRITVDERDPLEVTLKDEFSTPGRYPHRAWFYPVELAPGPHRVRVELLASDLDTSQELFFCGFISSGQP